MLAIDRAELHQRVQILDVDGKALPGETGTIAGFGSIMRDGKGSVLVLVQLDQGFYNPGRTGYVSILAVHPDSLETA